VAKQHTGQTGATPQGGGQRRVGANWTLAGSGAGKPASKEQQWSLSLPGIHSAPVATSLLMAAILLAGGVGYLQLPVSRCLRWIIRSSRC